ncbi:hypothetical protein U5903_05875 [Cereibacter johrii]|uniref:hypothetical protein n=1 Tax=Cereibacter johrii TaxID=445629 RepID=UPI002B258085|nr:hypothetical protein [Cereibacter johrii]MEA5160301.1 hypothetical protein [Cereibacter johrii]
MSAILRIALPLTLWLAGFSAVYGLHGLVCSGGWPGGRLLLIAGGGAVLALQLGFLLALRSRRFGDPGRFVRGTSLLLAVVALVATLWTLIPVAVTSTCLPPG